VEEMSIPTDNQISIEKYKKDPQKRTPQKAENKAT
jgi:hypothetical protein